MAGVAAAALPPGGEYPGVERDDAVGGETSPNQGMCGPECEGVAFAAIGTSTERRPLDEGENMGIDSEAYYIVNSAARRVAERLVDVPVDSDTVYDWRSSEGGIPDDLWICDGCNADIDAAKPVPAVGANAECQPCVRTFFGYPDDWWDDNRTSLCDCAGCTKSWTVLARTVPRDALLALFKDGAGLPTGVYTIGLDTAESESRPSVRSAAGNL